MENKIKIGNEVKDGNLTKEEKADILKVVGKKQRISASYTIKAFGGNIDRLRELDLISDNERAVLRDIQTRTIEKWTKQLIG